jgi:hypothetical protein
MKIIGLSPPKIDAAALGVTRSGVNFTNVIFAAFTREDPIAIKWMSTHQCFFALLGSVRVKAAHKMLVKLTLTVNFANTLAQNTNAHVYGVCGKKLRDPRSQFN